MTLTALCYLLAGKNLIGTDKKRVRRDKTANTFICIENRLRKSVAIFHSLTPHAAPSNKYISN